jgi:putative two-component system response regulator
MADSILIVDDEELFRTSLTRTLERAGYWCASAEDVAVARVMLSERMFELVLCDVNMPGESGLELLKYVLSAHADTAAVMVTAIDEPAFAEVAMNAGAYGYIIKPFTANEILIAVSGALRRRRLEAENDSRRTQLVEQVRGRTEDLWRAVQQLEKADVRLQGSMTEMVHRLSLAAELRDEETAAHLERVSRYAGLLAQRLGIDSDRCTEIVIASRLHDAGKIGVPDRVLRKPGPFTPDERAIMQRHALVGHQLFANSECELLELGATIALTHHERWDGNGYPSGLAAEAIPMEGRIATVADIFDALMSKRPYKPAYPLPKVIEIMKQESGGAFDPKLSGIFLESLDDVLAIAQTYGE